MDKARAQIIHKLVEDMRTGERKERTALVRRAALALGLDPKSVYRLLREAGWESGRKTRRDAGQSAVDEDLALAVGGLVKQATRANGKRTLTIEGTRRLLEAQGYGVADAETGEITMPSSKTLSTVMRRLGCHPDQVARGKATGRLRSLHPNHAWQVDSSVCVLFYLPGGKKMRLMDETLYNAKKPGRLVEIGRQRVIRYVVTDHCTHSLYVRYDQAAGEDAAGVLTTLIEAMSDRGPRDPMHGVPSILYMDKSGGNQSSLIRNFCATLGIELHYHAAGNAPATGSVEVAQNIVEREFEGRLRFADVRDLEQLQEMADRWRRHYNAHAVHRRLACTRNAAWLRITPEQLRVADREALTAVAQWGEQTRRVRPDYTISVNTRSHGTHTYGSADPGPARYPRQGRSLGGAESVQRAGDRGQQDHAGRDGAAVQRGPHAAGRERVRHGRARHRPGMGHRRGDAGGQGRGQDGRAGPDGRRKGAALEPYRPHGRRAGSSAAPAPRGHPPANGGPRGPGRAAHPCPGGPTPAVTGRRALGSGRPGLHGLAA